MYTEKERIQELTQLGILDTETEERFDRITRLVSETLRFPTVLVYLVDLNRQWFKSACGLDIQETPREISFCTHAITQDGDMFIIPNALENPQFQNSPLVAGTPHIRFYAGVVLRSPKGLPLGTLCAIDYVPREIDGSAINCLKDFAEIVRNELYRNADEIAWLNESDQVSAADLLSMAMNIKDFRSAAKQILQHASSNKIAGFICDVPKLDNISRTFGNDVSRELISEVARRIRLAISDQSFLLGRDLPHRFIGLVDMSGIDAPLKELAHTLKFTMGNRVQTSTAAISTPINIGLTLVNLTDNSVDNLFREAQIAVDDIPVTSSGTTTSIFRPELRDSLTRCYSIAAILESALSDNKIQVFLQPKVNVSNGQISGAEALIRWTDDQLGVISPLEVLEAARKIGLMPLLDESVLRSACSQLATWIRQGHSPLPISINLSEETFALSDFAEWTTSILLEYQIPHRLIDFEILESSVFQNMDQSVQRINALRASGIKFSLDDFGTGYSSLSYLQILPIDNLKIDRSFITDIVHDPSSSAMLHHIIKIGHTLGMTIIAEGIENIGQYLILRSYGCDYIQGYYFAKPMPVQEFEHMIFVAGGHIQPPGMENF